ncbi:MAG: hypothetical protein A2X02_04425 [Bacteroidetes bacterium GWF2_29_10]|nr:MAG: hypothetical protein A2X02_04425 [Bacteroidetes bacterium GWF2_29_10]
MQISTNSILFKLLLLCNLFFTFALKAQNEEADYYVKDRINNKNSSYTDCVKSIELTKGVMLSSPEILLNSRDKLKLSFDVMGHNYKDYNYTVYLCDYNWEKSILEPNEYIEGFAEGYIRDYKFSFNRLISYIHYEASIPDDMMQITKSGNYVLQVYPDGKKDSIIFTKRFIVYESLITINANIKEAINIEDKFYKQKIDFTINTGTYNVMNPYTDLKVVVNQNNRWDNAISSLKPKYVNGNNLIYNNDRDNVFNGSNEYRFLDIKSLRYNSFGINNILYEDTIKVNLIPESSKRFEVYSTRPDIDGNFIIKTEDNNNSETESEYVLVHFFLKTNYPIIDGGVYVGGGFNNYAIDNRYKMVYNYQRKMYELKLLLKQGYYNYFYMFLPNGENVLDETYFEGSHRETNNLYSIYVYNTELGIKHDRIIGILKLSNGK